MVMKLDLEKAYDKVNWDFLEASLDHFGFPEKFITIIMRCVRTTSLSILWNRETTAAFKPSQGLRQRDPLSPYLLVIYIEFLSHMIHQAVERKLWSPLQIGKNGIKFFHLFFADDLILFSKASPFQARNIMKALQKFQDLSGQVK